MTAARLFDTVRTLAAFMAGLVLYAVVTLPMDGRLLAASTLTVTGLLVTGWLEWRTTGSRPRRSR